MAANQHNSVNLVDEAIEKGHQEQKWLQERFLLYRKLWKETKVHHESLAVVMTSLHYFRN